MPNIGKILAFDYGTKRVGVARTDPEGNMAYPLCTLKKESREQFFLSICALIEKEAPAALLVGLPLHQDGAECLATREARNFAQSLTRRVTQPVYLINEVLSSFEAEQDLRECGLSLAKAKTVVDQQAAVRILESFLSAPTLPAPLPQPAFSKQTSHTTLPNAQP